MSVPLEPGQATNAARLEPRPVAALTGDETIVSGIRVRDFWSWGFSDLRMNTTRGMLAQFLVARALEDPRPTDEGWGNYDVLTPEGTRVEVKSSAYLQSWRQSRFSEIVFRNLTGHAWSDTEGYTAERVVRADVFVFAVHTCQDPSSYDMLEATAWQFRVVPASLIEKLGVRGLGWSTLIKHAPQAVPWAGLRTAVRHATSTEERPEESAGY